MMPKGCAKPGNRRSHSPSHQPSQLGMVPSSRGFLVRQRAAFASRGKRDTVRKTVSGSQSVILVLHWILLLPPSGLRAAFLRVSPNFNSILLSAKQNPCINLWVLLNGELYVHTVHTVI
jgi:hypothetical protein